METINIEDSGHTDHSIHTKSHADIVVVIDMRDEANTEVDTDSRSSTSVAFSPLFRLSCKLHNLPVAMSLFFAA